VKVSDVMTVDVATCAATDSLNRAAQLMWERRCGSAVVLDENGRVGGIVTDRDICMAAYTQGRRLDDIPVTTAMSSPVTTCPPIATVEAAEALMMAHAVRRLPVVDPQGRLLGVLSIDDIARSGTVWDGKGDVELERVAVTLGEISRRTTGNDQDVPPEVGTDLAEVVRNSREALETLRHELAVDLELAGEEVRRRWMRLEARLHAAELGVRDRGHAGARDLAELVEHAHHFRSRLNQGRRMTRS
jgi:CBS domain-containing protein